MYNPLYQSTLARVLYLFCSYRCSHGGVLSISYRYLLCLVKQLKKLHPMLLHFCNLLLFTVVTHAESDHVSNITGNQETNPTIHGASTRSCFGASTGAPNQEVYPIQAGQRGQGSVTSHTAQRQGRISSEGPGGRAVRGWGQGDFSVRECKGVGHCSSCPRGLLISDSPRGEGKGADLQHCSGLHNNRPAGIRLEQIKFIIRL